MYLSTLPTLSVAFGINKVHFLIESTAAAMAYGNHILRLYFITECLNWLHSCRTASCRIKKGLNIRYRRYGLSAMVPCRHC